MEGNVSGKSDPKSDVVPVVIFASGEQQVEESVEERLWEASYHAVSSTTQGVPTTGVKSGSWGASSAQLGVNKTVKSSNDSTGYTRLAGSICLIFLYCS